MRGPLLSPVEPYCSLSQLDVLGGGPVSFSLDGLDDRSLYCLLGWSPGFTWLVQPALPASLASLLVRASISLLLQFVPRSACKLPRTVAREQEEEERAVTAM